MHNSETVWAALFVRAASPGAVFRFVERQRALGVAGDLLLSEPTPAQGWRILIAPDTSLESLRLLGESLSIAFPPSVILLDCSADGWSFTVWVKGEISEHEKRTISRPSPIQRALARVRGISSPLPFVAWGKERGLPVMRIPALIPGEKLPVIAYRTVSSLDERSLLIENQPRYYRFSLS